MTPKAIWQRTGKSFLLLVTLQILLLCFFSSPQTLIKITRRPVNISSFVSVAKAESIGITSTVHLPLVLVDYRPTLPPIVPDTTVVLSDTAGSRLTAIATDASVLTFTQSLTQPLILTPGNVLVSTSTAVVPNGLLRKITDVNAIGERLVVQTTAATLDEALQQGEVHISQPLSPSNIQSAHYSDGVHLSASSLTTQAAIFYLEIDDVVIFDKDKNLNTTQDQILANGSIEVEPTLNFDLLVRDWQIQQVHFSLTTSEKVDIEFQSKIAGASLKSEMELARYHMAPITVMVGIVPVVLTPILTLAVGVNGDVHVSLSTGITQQATLTGGLQYSNGSWGPVSEYTNSFQVHPPTVSVGGELKGYAGPRLQILLYGAVGPQIKLDGYVKLEADSSEIPWWKVYGGLELSAEFRMEVLSYELASYEVPEAIGVKQLLAQARSAQLERVEWYDNCRGAIWMPLTGFAPNSEITILSQFYNQNCETGEWYHGTWTQVYGQQTDSDGNLVVSYQVAQGDHSYTFTDEAGNQEILSFTIHP